jgi:ADP-heptose:LPS heptosyltransferase
MNKVYTTSTLDETYAIMKQQEKWTFRTLFFYLLVKIQILFYNLVLKTLQKLWFTQQIPEVNQINTIVVYGVGVLGDNIIRLAAIQTLKKHYTSAKIIVIDKHQEWSPKPVEELFKCTDYIDEMYFVENNPVQRKGLKFIFDDKLLPNIQCDLFVNLSNFDNRGWFGAVVREVILAKELGAKFAVGFTMTTVLNNTTLNAIKHRLVRNFPRLAEGVLEELQIKVDYSSKLFLDNTVSKNKIDQLLLDSHINQPFAVLHPGAKLECKMWPAKRFADVARYLQEQYGMRSVVTGVSNESHITQQVANLSAGNAVDFAAKTSLSETIELLGQAAIVISNDTGVMHLAAVANIPTLGIYSTRLSPTNWFSSGEKFKAIFSFSATSLRHTDENDISDLLQISSQDVCCTIDVMINEYKVVTKA